MTREHWISGLCILASVGSGTVGGLLFGFSTSVMKALNRQPAPAAIATMQAINIVILNPIFLAVFMGTAAVCLATLVLGVLNLSRAGAVWMIVGSLLYLVTTFGLTAALHVPMNDKLATTEANAPDAQQVWQDYSSRWTRWNHLRAATGIAAAGAFAMALKS